MKKLLLMLLIAALVLAGCAKEAEPETNTTETETAGTEATDTETEAVEPTEDTENTDVESLPAAEEKVFEEMNYTDGLDENGFFEGVAALDFVELFEYKNIDVPADVHTITDEQVDAEVDYILNMFASAEQVTDRAVVDGDTLNIDYVGSIDGVEFEGGSTGGAGTEVTIGVTSYIDDFLAQLVGHTPGENFDIEVTFPADYGKEDLQGKDAVFNITINYIVENVTPEISDAFVVENLSAAYGWQTVEEMRTFIIDDMKALALREYIQGNVIDTEVVTSLPDTVLDFQKIQMKNYYIGSAMSYNMTLEEFLPGFTGHATMEEVYEASVADLEDVSKYTLLLQAIAEDAGIGVSDEDVAGYFLEINGSEDYSMIEEQYGIKYIKYVILQEMVFDYIINNANLL